MERLQAEHDAVLAGDLCGPSQPLHDRPPGLGRRRLARVSGQAENDGGIERGEALDRRAQSTGPLLRVGRPREGDRVDRERAGDARRRLEAAVAQLRDGVGVAGGIVAQLELPDPDPLRARLTVDREVLLEGLVEGGDLRDRVAGLTGHGLITVFTTSSSRFSTRSIAGAISSSDAEWVMILLVSTFESESSRIVVGHCSG